MRRKMVVSGEKIKQARAVQGMSRAELSRRSGVPVRTLEDWESGRRNPTSIDALVPVARALGTGIDMLYSDEYISALNAQALSNMDQAADIGEDGAILVDKAEDIYAQQGVTGLVRLLDRFIAHVGIEESLKIVEGFMDESNIG